MERATAPAIWPLEVANGLLQAERRGRITEAFRKQRLVDLGLLRVILDDETSRHAWQETSDLALRHGLSAYDAAYLELALRRALPLATLDKSLARAAERENVTVL